MWIRSQDRKDLIKTENVSVVDRTSTFVIETDTKESIFTLGEYSTEEKALKVLDMIQEEMLKINCVTEPFYDGTARMLGYIEPPKVLQMPQEDEVE